MVTICDYLPEHYDGVYRCMLALQAHERELEALHRPPEEMATEYLAFLRAECAAKDGQWFVAVDRSQAVGFLCVWRHELLDEYMAQPVECAYISDLVVLPEYRRHGIGPRLIAEAERYAQARGVTLIKIGSLARNYLSKELYRRLGFRDYSIQFVKKVEGS